jgi:cell division protease FtsH
MPQDDLKQNDKSGFPRFRPRGDDDNSPRKGPKFSIYWIWGIIAAVLIGFNLFGGLSPDAHQIEELEFRRDMLAKGDVEKLDLISNKQLVRVYIKKDSIQKPYYANKLKGSWPGGVNKEGPQFEFKVTDVKEYEKRLQEIFTKNPQLENIPHPQIGG